MSTMRRPLGTGPSASRSTSTTASAPRLLPVERVDPPRLLDDPGHGDVAERRGRRTLGAGIERTPDDPCGSKLGGKGSFPDPSSQTEGGPTSLATPFRPDETRPVA